MHSKRKPTAAESAHMGRIKAMRCVCCSLLLRAQEYGTDVHHVDENGQARNHWLVIPLCWDCHQGTNGVHGTKRYLAILKKSQWELLAVVIEWMEQER